MTDRLQEIRRHHADATCNPNHEGCFLLIEVDRLTAELAKYETAFAGMWVEPDAFGEPCVWINRDQAMPIAWCSDTGDELWNALAAVLPTEEQT